LHPAFAPSPYLRTDVINNRSSGVFDSFGEPEIEVRKVDQNCCSGKLRFDPFRKPPKHAVKMSQGTQHLERADNSRLTDVTFEFDAGVTHARPAEAVELRVRKFAAEAAHHLGAVHVGRCFTGDDQKSRRHYWNICAGARATATMHSNERSAIRFRIS